MQKTFERTGSFVKSVENDWIRKTRRIIANCWKRKKMETYGNIRSKVLVVVNIFVTDQTSIHVLNKRDK